LISAKGDGVAMDHVGLHWSPALTIGIVRVALRLLGR
jgi:hypothetical protein